ncbi:MULTISPECIES: WXG100 family type VII secretion target [unclassified Streptomyces]|uniref:WXG100 family type VII secretion target n=1 Tax=unclassified Streptomyces TaxID=2593676 RepID=UPI00278BF7A6|nr:MULTISPECIES: WXG100 family type VII secretion target [unclassified Streptomyces]
MSGPAGAAVDAYSKVNDWMSPMSGVLDELMRPFVEPLAEQLEFVTGDPEGLQAASDLWKKQAEEMRDLIADQRRDRSDLSHEWTGEAADAFMNELIDLEAEFEAEAADMEGTAELLKEAADECRVIQDMVEDVIRELIEWAIVTLAASAAFAALTAGVSAAAGAAAAAAEGSLAATRIATLVARLARVLQKIADAMKALKALAKTSRFKPAKPWTWKSIKEPGQLEAFAAKKVVKTTGKAVLGAVGLTGDPVGQTAQDGATGAAGIAADEADDRLAGNRNPSTAAREDTGIANPSDADHQTVEPRFRDNPFG